MTGLVTKPDWLNDGDSGESHTRASNLPHDGVLFKRWSEGHRYTEYAKWRDVIVHH